MRRILVPVDGSPSSDHAVQHVAAMVKSGIDAEIHVLHVQRSIIAQTIPDIAQPGLLGHPEAEELLNAFASCERILKHEGTCYSTHCLAGDPAQEIALYADVHDCTEIVMGTRGMGAAKNLLLGSVAATVVHFVRIPVTLVK